MYCENQIDPVTWWRSTEFRQKSFISLSLATKREIQKSETMSWKIILMRSFWYQKFEDPTIHVTVATCAKFWGLKLQNGFTHARLRGRDPIFRYCPIIRTCSFIWASQNELSRTPCKSPVLFRPGANRFCIDEDAAFELSGVNSLKKSSYDIEEKNSPKFILKRIQKGKEY